MENNNLIYSVSDKRGSARVIKQVIDTLPQQSQLFAVAELFKIFGDPTRVAMLYALSVSPMCVCDIAEALNMSHSAISHQLRLLKANRLVQGERKGKHIIYSLADDHIKSMLSQGMEHVNE